MYIAIRTNKEYSMYLLYSCPVGFFPPFAYRVFLFNDTLFFSNKNVLLLSAPSIHSGCFRARRVKRSSDAFPYNRVLSFL